MARRDVRTCAEDILTLLDQEGSCPSVVNRNSREPEKGLNTTVYAALSKVPLYRHALNVADRVVSPGGKEAAVPKLVIAGLAHDLGKLPSYQEKLFSTGDHSFIAPLVLGKLESFKKLPFASEIIEAISLHHRPKPEPDLAKRLRDADQAARKQELTDILGPERHAGDGSMQRPETQESANRPASKDDQEKQMIAGSSGGS